jgi:hypothetical protein
MTTYPAPGPVSVFVDLVAGALTVTATDTDEVTVDVRPSDPSKNQHVKSAEQTRVEFTDGRLVVHQPKTLAHYSWFGSGISVDVTIKVPAGSSLEVQSPYASVRADGALGRTSVKTSYGDVTLDQVEQPFLHTGYGAITARRIVGDADIVGAGRIRIGAIEGAATIKNKYEGTAIGLVTGRLEVNASYGDIDVDHALAPVAARTAYGRVRVGEVVRGTVQVDTSYGGLEIGIRDGSAAWLDLSSDHGVVRNTLEAADGPGGDDEPADTVEVRGHTKYGDIFVRRATVAG